MQLNSLCMIDRLIIYFIISTVSMRVNLFVSLCYAQFYFCLLCLRTQNNAIYAGGCWCDRDKNAAIFDEGAAIIA